MKLHAHILKRRYAGGMTLVEVLIAAIVIAIGLLGIASLQISALQGASDAQFRSRATDITASLADRIRSNLTAIAAYAAPNTIPTDSCILAPDAPLGTIQRCAMSPDGDVGVVSACTDADMAAYDLWELNCALQGSIPGAELEILCPGGCGPMAEIQVTIRWEVQNRNPNAATATDNFITHEVVSTILPGVQP
ncbi:MAG: type IV pilus modification protein PilV [Candidatus Thiodiazotropha sp. (ex Lucina aurantia)]|uniref:Type IV pilus modification protein PilV n=1 Tax=Candidatus Thiodiazotropha taylori TaxID=2792791 RepID=A0A9E4T674_9GAMM|nr:type IV pilus modification protein PilV [Candidatus Thiodiazotropha sp. (ex Lucina pensylvanica)]MBT3023506.1 type IV pilus modification protein PilV [Candidatus Thiodiazotropha taylori]MBV2098551.1 type IV pilus modification protein PilV [Candidatus Thiodiazotropha sp. (ex Codakia orbicularis)]MBV2103567.1 type IV pilus modification protein PilV [Candidatus Thiodiazotropha sp. (ex Lucina aurantia)]MBV2117909.1 type IV pilus modification protein PilV [Candidatus Thiodiazotropha sp. (ex Lucin